jgi:hypothetical protein
MQGEPSETDLYDPEEVRGASNRSWHSRLPAKRKGSPYRSGRSPDWLKMKNPDAPAVRRQAEEEWR